MYHEQMSGLFTAQYGQYEGWSTSPFSYSRAGKNVRLGRSRRTGAVAAVLHSLTVVTGRFVVNNIPTVLINAVCL